MLDRAGPPGLARRWTRRERGSNSQHRRETGCHHSRFVSTHRCFLLGAHLAIVADLRHPPPRPPILRKFESKFSDIPRIPGGCGPRSPPRAPKATVNRRLRAQQELNQSSDYAEADRVARMGRANAVTPTSPGFMRSGHSSGVRIPASGSRRQQRWRLPWPRSRPYAIEGYRRSRVCIGRLLLGLELQ